MSSQPPRATGSSLRSAAATTTSTDPRSRSAGSRSTGPPAERPRPAQLGRCGHGARRASWSGHPPARPPHCSAGADPAGRSRPHRRADQWTTDGDWFAGPDGKLWGYDGSHLVRVYGPAESPSSPDRPRAYRKQPTRSPSSAITCTSNSATTSSGWTRSDDASLPPDRAGTPPTRADAGRGRPGHQQHRWFARATLLAALATGITLLLPWTFSRRLGLSVWQLGMEVQPTLALTWLAGLITSIVALALPARTPRPRPLRRSPGSSRSSIIAGAWQANARPPSPTPGQAQAPPSP